MSGAHPSAAEQELLRALRATRKYGRVHPGVLGRVARRSLATRGRRDALKAAKRSLHELAGAFLDADSSRRAERLVRSMADAGAEERRTVCRAVLGLHASSAERMPVMEELYERIWQAAADARGVPRSAPVRLLDLACGLGPFALPWMGLAPGSSYRGVDADGRVVDLARTALPYLEAPELREPPEVEAGDVLEPAAALGGIDVVVMLKTLPTLERLAPGAGVDLVRRLTAPVVVITTATGSLGGRRHLRHDELIERTLADSGRQAARFEVAGESVAVAWPAGHDLVTSARKPA
ncbi:MAG: hypothetical protein OXC31_06490 [Spirochaetaceae bacterium]|nr:hypothetical protein [Spirochaetaceae bacterium]